MPDLEKQIAEWRRQMAKGGIKSAQLLDELESHLREEIERLVKSGMAAQQAFEMTVLQIGQAKELKREFAKDTRLTSFLQTELIRKEWDLKCGPVLHAVIISGVLVAYAGMVLFKMAGFAEVTPYERVSSIAAVVVSSLLFSGGLWGYRFFPAIVNKYVRLVIYACGAVLITIWLMAFLARVNVNTPHQFLTEFSWAFFVPLGAFSSLILGVEKATLKKVGLAGFE